MKTPYLVSFAILIALAVAAYFILPVIHPFYSFIGTTKENYLTDSLCNKIHDLVSYFGSENIFGTDYYPMSKEEAIERYL